LSQDIVNSVKKTAITLSEYGGLALIAVGPDVDPKIKYLPQLTNNYAIWRNVQQSVPFKGWEDFFWHQAYGCVGNPPSDASTPGTVPTITFPVTLSKTFYIVKVKN
jgi:hypothetical protein